jgi:hypothetical protein
LPQHFEQQNRLQEAQRCVTIIASQMFDGSIDVQSCLAFATRCSLILTSFAAIAAPVAASESLVYSYDARGRLTKVERSGSVNNGVETSYQLDPTGNRQVLAVTGSQGRKPVSVVILPVGGYFVLPLIDPLSN